MQNKRSPLIQEIRHQDIEQSEQNEAETIKDHKILFIKEELYKCVVCRKNCNYTCPKCKKHYCSLDHFRSHNLFCSEQFYEKQVSAQLKSLKVKDKKEKQKVAQMYKNHQIELQESMLKIQLTPQRLSQILEAAEEGKSPQLTPKQQYFFQQYISSLKVESEPIKKNNFQQKKNGSVQEKEDSQPLLEPPFWEIQDGISYYINKTAQIEQYGESDYPEVVVRRHIYSKQIDEFKEQFPFREGVINPVIPCHLIQIIYAFLILYRAHDGQSKQFKDLLLGAYCSKQNQAMLKTECVDQVALVNRIEVEIKKVDERANGKWENENIIYLWFTAYAGLVKEDMKRVFKNKYILLQALLRIIEIYKTNQQEREKHQQREEKNTRKVGEKINVGQKSKQEEKMEKKIRKKCQYLIYYVLYYYSQTKMYSFIENINIKKLERVSQSFQIKN